MEHKMHRKIHKDTQDRLHGPNTDTDEWDNVLQWIGENIHVSKISKRRGCTKQERKVGSYLYFWICAVLLIIFKNSIST